MKDKCPICFQLFEVEDLEKHVNECLENPPPPSASSPAPQYSAPAFSSPPSYPIVSTASKTPAPSFIDLTREDESLELAQRLNQQDMLEEEEKEREMILRMLADEEREKRQEEERSFALARQLQENDAKEFQSHIRAKVENSTDSCPSCSNSFSIEQMFYLDSCPHMFCRSCLRTQILKKMEEKACTEISCVQCHTTFSPRDIKELLAQKEYETYEAQAVQELIDKSDTFVRCPNTQCRNAIERVTGQQPKKQKELGPDGTPLSDEAISHRNEFRFRCQECQTEFCAKCKTIPYHLGFTCEKFVTYQQAKHCRFCATQLTAKNTAKAKSNEIPDVCTSDECVAKRELSCVKTLSCGHPCHGVKNETQCLRCLHDDCTKDGQSGGDLCNICWIDGLENAPCVQLDCGHVFHYICAKKKINNGWSGARITFSFLDCALCKKRMSHTLLQADLKPMIELYDTVLKKAMQRLQVMGHNKAPELSDPKSRYFNNPENYAMDKYSYYTCFKCKKPYFGGERACDAQNRLDEFNPEELICGGCSSSGKNNCPKHNADYIEYKCKFCCSVAQWFCWGNTHFCDPCHAKASTIVHVPRDQLPKCTCSVQHPPNGEEYCLGCSMCILSGGGDY